ncbi:MAG: hypothetical protein HYY30_03225 [Chloroflexi bacterium]|nr:hypothetical protein [Chloroflexota bacterium]
MKKEFVVERQGKMFVLYAGLLDEAHAQGLKSIKTSLLQVPTEDNRQTAICQATVETEKGVFTGIGDASPSNVAPAMTSCLIRMAETRAKARALRDAVNVGVAALEELNEDDDTPGGAHNGPAHEGITRQPGRSDIAPGNGAGPAALATPAQIRTIYLIGRDQHGLSSSQMEERCVAQYGCAPTMLSKKQASELITALSGNGK